MTQAAVLDRDLNIFDPRLPRSTVSKVSGCLAAFATQARLTLTADMFIFPLL